MLPKNNRNIFPDNSNVQPSTSNGNQQFRPSVSVSGNPFSYNSNLVVTQQQQPNRNNNAFQLNAPSNNNNNSTTISQFVAAMQQPQNPSLHLINRASQSPIQINPNQSSQILMDRSQMIRLPQNTQADPTGINNLYQALYIIQQKFLQTDKTKPITNHVPEICRPVVSTIHNPSVLNNASNSLTAITINSTSNNQNPTVLAMSNADIQLLEAIGRLSSQQGSKQACHANVSLIQSDSAMAQQLLTALQKQSPRTSTAVSSPSFMVIGQTSKPNQTHSQQTKDTINISPALSNTNGTELSNSLLLKMPINSKAEIPVWTKLLDKLSSNSDNSTEVNRSCKIRDLEDNQRKILSQPRLQSNNSKGHTNEYIQRSSDFQSSTSGLKSSSSTSKSLNNNDTHQILRDNKALSYLVSSPNNVSINNDYMVDEHFQKSLWDKMNVKKTHNQGNSFNFQSFDSNNGNTDIINMKNPVANKVNVRNKTFIDLERPDSRNKNISDCMTRGSTPTQTGSCIPNSQLTIKQKADAMVENLLKRSLNSNYSANKTYCGTNMTHTHVTNDISCITTSSNKGCQSSINTHTNNVVINPRDNLINSTSSMLQDTSCKVLPFQSCRPNPSKSDLPLKKRIMLDFNENGDENISEKHLCVIKPESKIEMNTSNEEKQIKIRRKRIHTDSLNSDSKTDSSSHDPSLPIAKKRRGRIPGTGKNQKLKEQCRLKEMAKINLAGIEENWQELVKTIIRPPDSMS